MTWRGGRAWHPGTIAPSTVSTSPGTVSPPTAIGALQPVAPNAAVLGIEPELLAQLLLCFTGFVNEPALRASLIAHLDGRAAAPGSMPSGKAIVSADRPLDFLATQMILGRPRPEGNLELFEYVMGVYEDWQAAHAAVHLHRASAFYWAGIRDIQLDNLDRGLLYMHQAAMEDEASHERPAPPTPATWFVWMDPTDPKQAYWERVKAYHELVEQFAAAYRAEGLGSMTADDLRARLQRADKLDAANGLLQFVARYEPLTRSEMHRVRDNAFAALVYSQLLLALVFEEILAPLVPSGSNTLGKMLVNYVAPRVSITNLERDEVMAAVGTDPAAALTALLDTGSLPTLTTAPTAETRDAYILLAVRNTSAHRLLRSPIIATRFEDLATRSMNAVLYLVEHQYP